MSEKSGRGDWQGLDIDEIGLPSPGEVLLILVILLPFLGMLKLKRGLEKYVR